MASKNNCLGTNQKSNYLVKWNSSRVCNDESSYGAANIVKNLRSVIILGNDCRESLQKCWVVSANKIKNKNLGMNKFMTNSYGKTQSLPWRAISPRAKMELFRTSDSLSPASLERRGSS
jgi:hypothetical protein